ncbi:hypothetical protein Vafri_15873, partial [Volvox africanus]
MDLALKSRRRSVKLLRDEYVENEGVIDERCAIGRCGPFNWPTFDLSRPIYGVRSFARWSLPKSCGPLHAGRATLVPSFTPRNHYFTTNEENGYEVDNVEFLKDQMNWFQSMFGDSHIPRSILRSLLQEDVASHLEVPNPQRRSNLALAKAAISGFPRYDRLAAELRGNRLAAVPLPGGVTAMFSAAGQIGEILVLTLLRPSSERVDAKMVSEQPNDGGRGGGSGDGVPAAVAGQATKADEAVEDSPPFDPNNCRTPSVSHPAAEAATAHAAAAAGGGALHLQAFPAAQLSVNKTIWEIAVKEHKSVKLPGGLMAGQNRTGGGGGGASSSFGAPRWSTQSAPAAAPEVKREEGPMPRADDCSWGEGGPAVWVALRSNYCINVLLSYQVDAKDWRSWRLEWRASHVTQRLIASMAWNPHLPELALMLMDGSVFIASTHAAAGGVAASLRRLAVRQVLLPMPPLAPYGRGQVPPPPPMERDPVPAEPMGVLFGKGRLCVSYGVNPRTLLVTRGRYLLKVELKPRGQRHKCSLLHYLRKKEGCFWGLATGASLAGMQLSAAPHQLVHLVVAVGKRDVLLIDPRRKANVVLLAITHGMSKGQMPNVMSLWVGPWHTAAAAAAAAAATTATPAAAAAAATTAAAAAADGLKNNEDVEMEDAAAAVSTEGGGGPFSGFGGEGHQYQFSSPPQLPRRTSLHAARADSDPYGMYGSQKGMTGNASQQGSRMFNFQRGSEEGGLRVEGRDQKKKWTSKLQNLMEFSPGIFGPNHAAVLERLFKSRQDMKKETNLDGADARSAAAAVPVISPTHGSVHVVILLANERSGDVLCLEVVLEEPMSIQIDVPQVPAGDMNAHALRKAKLPCCRLQQPSPRSEDAFAAAAAAAAAEATGRIVGESDCGGGAAAGSSIRHPGYIAGGAAAATHGSGWRPPPPANLDTAVWRPNCLAHIHLLGMPYPPCNTVREDVGQDLVTALLGARSAMYDTVGAGSGLAGKFGRLTALKAEFVSSGRMGPDLAGLAVQLVAPYTTSSCSSNCSAATPADHAPLLLMRLSYDGDLLLQPLRRLPPGSILPTRAEHGAAVGAATSVSKPKGRSRSGAAVAAGSGFGGGSGADCAVADVDHIDLKVEALESPFILADLRSRLSPADYVQLLKACGANNDAQAASNQLKPAVHNRQRLDSPPPKQQRDKLDFSTHYIHLASMLRWANRPVVSEECPDGVG